MPKLGTRSKQQLMTCQNDIIRVVNTAIALDIMDFSVVEGYRDEETQNKYYDEGKSKVRYPYGNHNIRPSCAVDIAPYVNGQISWNKLHCIHLAGIILAVARMMGVNMRWGGNWDMDYEPITDQSFQDLVHYELVR